MKRAAVSKLAGVTIAIAAVCLAWSFKFATNSAGSVLLVGGGQVPPEIANHFVAAAGGPKARIVVVSALISADSVPHEDSDTAILRQQHPETVSILAVSRRYDVDEAARNASLESATGIWLAGGFERQILDVYSDTVVDRKLHALLHTGGVVAGTSAGATVLGTKLIRSSEEGNLVLLGRPGEEGFSLLRDAAIDQHLLTRGRENDLRRVLMVHADWLGIGIDEGTAALVESEKITALGISRVVLYRSGSAGVTETWMSSGESVPLPGVLRLP